MATVSRSLRCRWCRFGPLWIGALAAVATTPARAQPVNDLCSGAATVDLGAPVVGTLEEAGEEFGPLCDGSPPQGPGVWYRVVGDGTTLTARLVCTSNFRGMKVLCAGCDYQFCVASGSSVCPTAASATWCSEPGVEYLILAFGDPVAPALELTVESDGKTCEGAPNCAPPLNDACSSPQPISIGIPVQADSKNATSDFEEGCGSTYGGLGVWFEVRGDGTTLSATLECEVPASHSLAIQCGDCEQLVCVGENRYACVYPTPASWCSQAGAPYRILVTPNSPDAGEFTLTVNSNATACGDAEQCYDPPPNDLCASPWPLAPDVTQGGTTHGSDDSADDDCGAVPPLSGDVWYSVTGDGTTFRASLCDPEGEPPDHGLHLYCGQCDYEVCVDGGYAGSSCDPGDEIRWCTAPGERYLLRVTGPAYEITGDFALSVSSDAVFCGPAAPCLQENDLCDDAAILTLGETVHDVTDGMTNDAAPFCFVYDRGPGLWYDVIGDGTVMEAVVCSVTTNPLALGVYCGACDSLACVEQTYVERSVFPPDCEDGEPAIWRWCSREGERYRLHVFEWLVPNPEPGQFTLKVQTTGIRCAGASNCVYDPPPANDRCAHAIPISGEGLFPFENTHATPEEPFDMCHFSGLDIPTHDVWYCWTSTCDGPVTVETCGTTTVDTQLAVFDDCNCDNREIECNDDDVFNACGYQSRVSFDAVKGRTYAVQVGTHLGLGGGSGSFRVSCEPAPLLGRACTFAGSPDLPWRSRLDALNSTRGQYVVVEDLPAQDSSAETIDRLCWWGANFDGANACRREEPDDFRVTYYADDCGKPGAVLGGPFSQSDGSLLVIGPARLSQMIAGIVPELEYSATHAAVANPTGAAIWVEITNSPEGDCSWYWETQSWRDARSIQSADSPGSPAVLDHDALVASNLALLVDHFSSFLDRGYDIPLCFPLPENDFCENPPLIGVGETVAINTTATFPNTSAGNIVIPAQGPSGELVNYFPFGDRYVHKDLWFAHEAACTATLEVDLCDADFNVKAALYESRSEAVCSPYAASLQPIAISDNECGPELAVQTLLTAQVRSGEGYRLTVGGYRGAFGLAAMTLSYAPPQRTSLREFAHFVRCFAGGSPSNECCGAQDFNADRDVDHTDLPFFLRVLAGP